MRKLAATVACLLAITPAALPSKAAAAPAAPEKAAKKSKSDAAEEFFATGPIPRLHVELTPENLNKLRKDGRAYAEATVRETQVGGQAPEVVFEKVGIHLKGGAGSFREIDDRPGLTLNFGKFTPGVKFHGLRKVHLNNCVQDPSYLSENFGNAIFRDAGVPAARVTYARLKINERDMGVFVLKEGFSDAFLKRFFDDPSGTVYEGPYKDIEGGLPERVNREAKKPERFKELVAAAQEGDADKRRKRLARVLDVDRFLSFMAIETMTAHWDGYCPNANNYRVYHDPSIDRFVFLPHGTDQLFQQGGFPLVTNRGVVARALTDAAEDRAAYLDRVAELRKSVFTPQRLVTLLDGIAARLAPVMADVGADAARQHREQTEDFRRRVLERVKNIDQQLASQPKPLRFTSAGVAELADAQWQEHADGGNVKLDVTDEDGHRRLHLRAAGGDGVASFRTTVTLSKGHYVFEGPCRTAGVTAPAGPNTGAGLRISGGRRDERLVSDADWRPARFEFEVNESSRDVVLVCELRASAGEAWFDAGALKLRRK